MSSTSRAIPDWPPERFDHRGHFKKRAIPGQVKVAVIRAAGAQPGETTDAHCVYCGSPGRIFWPLTFTGKVGTHVLLYDLEFDHVIPEYRGGPNTAANLVLACRPCNRAKGHR